MTHVRQSVISVVILSYFDDVTLRMKIKHAKCGQYWTSNVPACILKEPDVCDFGDI